MTVELVSSDSRKQLCAQFRQQLLEDVIPFWLGFGLDSEYGGIITSLDRDGQVVDTDKSVWAQGRFLWVISRMLDRFGENEAWMNAAVGTGQFLEQHGFDPNDGRMWFHVTRNGQPIRKRRYSFSESFAAIGFAGLARVTGNSRWIDLATRCFGTFWNSLQNGADAKYEATRRLHGIGGPMIALVSAQELRHLIQWPDADRVIDQCIDTLRNRFCRPDIECVMETVVDDGRGEATHFETRTLNPGHAIEAAWFVLREGEFRKDPALVALGCQMLDWMWRRGWDTEFGGILYFVSVDDRPIQEYWHDMKFWWPHNEAIIATLLAWQLTGDQRWADRFNAVFDWTMHHFPDREHGEWFGYLHRDGSISSTLKGNLWKGPFHVPRMFLECIDILERWSGVNEATGNC